MNSTPAYKRAYKAIENVFADTSVPLAHTLDMLENLRDRADGCADCCRDDLESEAEDD